MRTRSRRVALIGLVLVLALITAGCFQIRMFKIDGRYSLEPGTSTAVQVDLYPMALTGTVMTSDQIVLLIGLDNLNFHSMNPWDPGGNWGGPLASVRNDAVANFLLEEGNCNANGVDASDMEGWYDDWLAYASVDRVDGTGLTWADLARVFRIRFRVERPAGTGDSEYGSVTVFSAGWADDGDGVAEGEELICTGMVAFSIPFRGA